MKRKIIIDTDPGQDDAVAILLALASFDKFDILGIVSVAGNAEIQYTHENARRLCEIADPNNEHNVSIYKGSGAPLARRLVTCQGFHGRNGLADIVLPKPNRKDEEKDGIQFISETLESIGSDKITICAFGPLTNLARCLKRQPHLCASIDELVLMGGAFSPPGNITPAAEFNMSVDPEAAKVVFSVLSDWGISITMMPLDVTHQAIATKVRIEQIRSSGTKCASLTADILSAWGHKPSYSGFDGIPLHDPCVIAYLLEPKLFSGKQVNVEIETKGQWTSGMTVVDWWGESGRSPNAMFMTTLNVPGYFDLISERLARLP